MRKGSRFHGLSKGRTAKRGEMNKTETEYSQILQADKLEGVIADWWFEPFSLRVTTFDGGKTKAVRYTPDFMVLFHNGTTHIIDTKGSGPDSEASDVRMKAAAERYYLWQFFKLKKQTKKQGGGWKRIKI